MSLSKNEIKFVKSLQQKKFRDIESLFIVEGIKLVGELLNSGNFKVKTIYHTEECDILFSRDLEAVEISGNDLGRISGLKSPNKVLAVVHYQKEKAVGSELKGMHLALDRINDPGNLGTIIRTADWFGVSTVICSKESVDKYNPKVVQASMGAIFRQEVIYEDLETVIKKFKSKQLRVYGAEMNGQDAFSTDLPEDFLMIMGSESHGISEELRSEVTPLTIPKFGESESLNVGMAAGILMAKYRQ